MMKRVIRTVLACTIFGWVAGLAAPSAEALDFSVLGLRVYTVFGFVPAPTGGDFAVAFDPVEMLPGIPGTVSIMFGGGYQAEDVFRTRTGADFSPVTDPLQVGVDRVELLLEPGIAFRVSEKRSLDATMSVRTVFRSYRTGADTEFVAGDFFPDADGILLNTLRGGVHFDGMEEDRQHHDERGIEAGSMVEWAPPFPGNRIYGNSDFLRLSAGSRLFVPLFDAAPDREANLFNLYLANQTVIDWLTGAIIPVHEQAKTGGYFEDDGLGGMVRGFDGSEMSSLFKMANNLEVRLVGPGLGIESLYPVLTLFVDAGYHAGYQTGGYFVAPKDDVSGFVASAGTNISINAFGITYLGYTFAWPLAGSRADGAAMGSAFTFGLHF